jgi:hypothetical protein
MTLRTLAVCALLTTALHSHAAWNTAGDAVTQGEDLTLTTAYLGAGDPDSAFNLSGSAALDIASIESLAGLPAYALDLSAEEAGTEGSLAWRSFKVAAGDTLRFDWVFTTAETDFEDHAFVVLAGELFTLATRSQPGSAPAHFSRTFTSAGLMTLAVGVIDTVDYLGVSTLQLSNLQISPVPEPASALLMLAGAAALISRRGRRAAR